MEYLIMNIVGLKIYSLLVIKKMHYRKKDWNKKANLILYDGQVYFDKYMSILSLLNCTDLWDLQKCIDL